MPSRWLAALLLLSPWSCQREREQPPPPAATAPSTTPLEADPPSPRERATRAGEAATARHFSMSVSTSKECAREAQFEPREGFVTLGVEVTIQAQGAVQVPANPF